MTSTQRNQSYSFEKLPYTLYTQIRLIIFFSVKGLYKLQGWFLKSPGRLVDNLIQKLHLYNYVEQYSV